MKYFDTLIEDQETTISILYKEQIIKIYSSEVSTIRRLTKLLGSPAEKYKKSKTYWCGASWNIDFFEIDKIKEILNRDSFVDKKVKPIVKEEKAKEKKKIKKDDKKKKEVVTNAKITKKDIKKKEVKTNSKTDKKVDKQGKVEKNKKIAKQDMKKNKKSSSEKFEQLQLMF